MLKNLSHLEAYYWIARLGSFHAAAERLGLTQPTVTARIKELEKGLGVQLFERSARGVTLTPQGSGMFDYVDRILTLVQDLEGRVRRGPLKGVLKFGAPYNFGVVCLASFLKAMQRDHPELTLAVTIDTSLALAETLEKGELDLAIMSRPPPSSALKLESLGFQRVLWAASPDRGLTGRLQPRDLIGHPMFTTPAPSHLFSMLMDWFETCGLAEPRLSTCTSVSAIADLVAAGAGISILPACMMGDSPMRALEVAPPVPDQEIVVALPKGKVNRAIPEIIRVIRSAVDSTDFIDAVERAP